MSTLTKVLIVLLTVSSIFLCGIVVTYVANAENYRKKYNDLNQKAQAAQRNEEKWKKDLDEKIKETDREKETFNAKIGDLERQVGELQVKLTETQRERDQHLQKVNSWTSVVENLQQTNNQQLELLNNTLAELKRAQTELVKEQSKLAETTTALMAKMAIVAQLEDKSKQLIEEKTALQNKLDQLLRQSGKTVVATPVTQPRDQKVREAPQPQSIGLKGLIKRIDLKNSLAEISIGAADGVKENMKFHVTRGDEFICDILILDVDADKAVGILDLVQQQPRIGDNVSTNL